VKQSSFTNRESINLSTLDELHDLTKEDPRQFVELIEMFLKELESSLASLDAAVKNKTEKDLARYAHSLKGASGSIGATRMSSLSKTLEEVALSARFDLAETIFKQVEAEACNVRVMLTRAICDQQA
jgi:HPt (histidine-containing phosphotransfer) domain-containing protein